MSKSNFNHRSFMRSMLSSNNKYLLSFVTQNFVGKFFPFYLYTFCLYSIRVPLSADKLGCSKTVPFVLQTAAKTKTSDLTPATNLGGKFTTATTC